MAAMTIARWRFAVGVLPCAAALLLMSGCSSLLLYYPSAKYDNKVVRGVVTHIATREEMEENWERKHIGVVDLPDKDSYAANHRRVTVTVDRAIGAGFFVYPFISVNQGIGIGDVVDVPLKTGSSRSFAQRLTISDVVCKAIDEACLKTERGSKRGSVGDIDLATPMRD